MQVFDAELRKLADDLGASRDDVLDRIERVTRDTIEEMERNAANLVRGHAHLPHLPRSFTHDVDRSRFEVSAEAGGDWSRLQGRLDVFIEYGTPTSRGIPHWLPTSDRYGPGWERAVEDAAEQAVLR